MGSTGMFVLGGLLQGAGQAITNNANAAREQALLNLRRQYQIEDRNYAADQEMAKTKAEIEGRKELVQETGEQNRKTEAVKSAGDAFLARLKGSIDLNNDKTIEALKHQYNISEAEVKAGLDLKNQLAEAGQTVDHWDITSDGRMVAFNKKGEVLKYSANPGSFNPAHKPEDDGDDGGGTIGGARAARSGTAPAPKKQASPGTANVKAQALAQLGNLVAEIAANPGKKAEYQRRYPAMFDAQGNLLPKDELIARVNQRYGG